MGRGSVSLKKMDQNRDFGVTQNNEHRIKIYSILWSHPHPLPSAPLWPWSEHSFGLQMTVT